MASGDDHVGGGFSPSSSGRNRGRDGGDARFTCVGSGGLWRKRAAKTRRGRGPSVHHKGHEGGAKRAKVPWPSTRAAPVIPERRALSRRATGPVVSFVPPSCPL